MIPVEEIKGYKLFAGLSEEELAPITTISERRICEYNSTIFSPDTPSEDLYLVEGGNDAIQIEVPLGPHEEKIVIHTLSKGEAFGWAYLGNQHARTATARCLDKTSLIAINGKELAKVLEADCHTGYIVMKNLNDAITQRLSYTTVAFRHEIRKLRKLGLIKA